VLHWKFDTDSTKKEAIQFAIKSSYTKWPDGRELEEVLITVAEGRWIKL